MEPSRLSFRRKIALLVISATIVATGVCGDDPLPKLQVTRVPSTIDGESQPVRYWVPESALMQPTPIFVSLHTWSADGSQDRSAWLEQAVRRNWVYLKPNFRGRNDHPEACGSPLARQDILDALDWALSEFQIDRERVYIGGVSGGGHMTLQMAAHHPDRFSAATAWCGPTDLAAWYRFHTRGGKPGKYAQMIAACCGGPPGASSEVDAQYKARSPVFHLANAIELPLDINAGVKDGITGSVPIQHSFQAYNTIAVANGDPPVHKSTVDELWKLGRIDGPDPIFFAEDPVYGREIVFRQTTGNARITIFEGTHEALTPAAFAWLEQQRRHAQD